MDDVIQVEVSSQEEGDLLIQYLTEMECWVTPFVIEEEIKGREEPRLLVKASMSEVELHKALLIVRHVEGTR